MISLWRVYLQYVEKLCFQHIDIAGPPLSCFHIDYKLLIGRLSQKFLTIRKHYTVVPHLT